MNVHDFSAKTIDGSDQKLNAWKGKVVLVVNVASKCGFTPQYKGLEAMHRRLKDKGLVIAGFPCDQFGHQEPGDEKEIKEFCSLTYDVSFPMYAKIEVNGDKAHPLYEHLKAEAPGLLGSKAIKWNFTKFLAGRDGRVLRRYAPMHRPQRLEQDVVAAL